jgi:hypothetical protein
LTIFSENCGFGCKIRLVKNQKTVENKGFLAIISITATRQQVRLRDVLLTFVGSRLFLPGFAACRSRRGMLYPGV